MTAPRTLALDGELTIAAAATAHERLLAALAGLDADLHLDLRSVDSCDSAGVQLLLSTSRSLQAQGRRLHLVAPAAPVRQALETYGLRGLAAAA